MATAVALILPSVASAAVSVKAKTVTYNISGKNGAALLAVMDRRGPKHGFLTHAIAQTAYTVSWNIDWRERGDSCRIGNAAAVLSITYTFPQVSGQMSPGLERHWARFMAGVRRHEQTHGRIARQMVNEAERSLSGLFDGDDPGCRRTQVEVKRVIAAVYAKYEARQVAFDQVEHAAGGNVERLVTRLSKG
jgi:predicted secreted Zn-dependent protease